MGLGLGFDAHALAALHPQPQQRGTNAEHTVVHLALGLGLYT